MEQTEQKILTQKIAAWTEGEFEEAALVEAVEAAAEDAAEHRNGFGAVVEDLTPEQQERCGELITFAFTMLDALDQHLQDVLDGLEAEDRVRVMQAGDLIARASFQLDQCFAEFRNQALAALGPTEIPNLNQLISVKNRYLEEPDDASKANFQESLDVERDTTLNSVRALMTEPQIPEVVSLANTFMAHMGHLNSLAEDLVAKGPEADYEAHFVALDMSFRELGDMVPMVQVALRAHGETEFPDLNYLLTMITEAATGNIADGPLLEALQAVELGFHQTYETFQTALPGIETQLAKEEVEAAMAAFDDDFKQGIEAVYHFLVERKTLRLTQARGFLLDFAKRLSGHKERLKELEALEGRVTCPRCATVNESDRQRCSQCGFHLPQNVGATQTTTFQAKEAGGLPTDTEEELLITTTTAKIYEAVNAIHAGTISDDAFLSEIEKFELLINANVNSMPDEPNSIGEGDAQKAVTQVYDIFEDGINLFHEGTDLLRSYIESRDEEVLKQGVKVIDQGAKKIQAAGQAVATAAAPTP